MRKKAQKKKEEAIMEEKFRSFIEKAGKILANCPPYTREEDKIAMLNRRFRLNKEDSKLLLDSIRKK